MEYSKRYKELNSQFQMGVNSNLNDSKIDIRFYEFKSRSVSMVDKMKLTDSNDDKINENLAFIYPVFIPSGMKKTKQVILLMHGLNERSWSKYLTWAEYLCKETGKAVILFPIAFHINRSPISWSNPRELLDIMDLRRKRNGEDRFLSFANLALSERISDNPLRFYSAGRQSYYDLSKLTLDIKLGNHPLFEKNTQLDIFSYSIGAFLSEITLLANPSGLFSDSKLFLFCGGGIFSSMHGVSRSIMDKVAFERLYQYYLNEFEKETFNNAIHDKAFDSFNCMISSERNQFYRNSFFENLGDKLKGISLLQDKVMPYSGVSEALGSEYASKCYELIDFPFVYSHENPFPVGNKADVRFVDLYFNRIFSEAASFLA